MMSNRFYLISSLCFVGGALLAFRAAISPISTLYLLGSGFFFVAAVCSIFKK
jgi:hypothetical protein